MDAQCAEDRTEEYIELYKALETEIRDLYDVPETKSAVGWLIQEDKSYRKLRHDLTYCRKVRNILQHEGRLGSQYPVTPSDEMVDFLRTTIAQITAIPKASDLCVLAREVYTAGLDDPIVPALQEMAQHAYTHVPILEDGRVIGAFSENTLLSHLVRNGLVGFDEGETFRSVHDLLPLDRHESETFGFVGVNASAIEVTEVFQKSLRKSERLGMVFVTMNGKPSERMLGIITSWDMAAFF